MKLTPETTLADEWEIDAKKLAHLRQVNDWPHVRLTRFDVRYTDEQIAFIVRERSAGSMPKSNVTGLTARSAGRAR